MKSFVFLSLSLFATIALGSDLTTVSPQYSQFFLPAPEPVEDIKKPTVVIQPIPATIMAAVPTTSSPQVSNPPTVQAPKTGATSTSANPNYTLTKEEIARTIGKYMGHMQDCYEQELKDKPTIHGKIVARFTIGKEGKVTKSEIQSSTMNDVQTETCIAYMFSRIPFGKPGPGVIEASYPLTFEIVPAFKN